MTTTDTDALDPHDSFARNLVANAVMDAHDGWVPLSLRYRIAEKVLEALAPIVAAEVRKAKAEMLTKRWVCQVARSGYHNGASCRPDDAHNDWGCDYYYEASIRATEYETGDSDEHR